MSKIPKKLHYIWFWRWKKSSEFEKYLESWKKYCPDYEIIEWNENNFDINKNSYCKKFYDKKKWAFASDYARIDILYNEWWIYLDTDIEILKNLDWFLDNKLFIGFQDVFSIWWSVIWCEKNNPIIWEILDVYKTKKTRIVIPNLLNRIFKKYWVISYSNVIIKTNDFTIYPKDYFYPFAYFENKKYMKITKNTFIIHHYDATWLPKIITKIVFPLIWIYIKIRYKNI